MEEFTSVNKKKVWIGVGILSVIVIMVVVSIFNYSRNETVKITKLDRQLIEQKLTLSGKIASTKNQMVYLRPEQGELKKIYVKPGQKVKKGSKLLEYESPVIQSEKQQADLAVKQARVKIESLKKQKSRGNNQQSLGGQGVGTGSIDEQIKLAQVELDQAKQQVQLAKKKQNQLIVKSKQNGVVVQVNENAQSGVSSEPVIIIQDTDALKIDAKVSEYDVLKLKKDQKAYIYSEALPDKKWVGKVTHIGLIPVENNNQSLTTLDEENANVNYPIELTTSDKLPLKLGSRVIIEIVTSSHIASALPQSTIKQEGNQSYVFVVKNQKAVKVPVKVGGRNEQWVEILSGVNPGEHIILNPSPTLEDGAEVTVE